MRPNRLAHALRERGVGPGIIVGMQMHNGTEYIEAMLAAFKLRAVPVNMNYRYVRTSSRTCTTTPGIVALVFDGDLLAASGTPQLRQPEPIPLVIVVDDATTRHEGSTSDTSGPLGARGASETVPGRSGDDLYLAYTGGTTGMPKGVVWRHEDIFFAAMGGGDPTTLAGPSRDPDEIIDRVLEVGTVMLSVAAARCTSSAQWGAFSILFGGGTVVLAAPGEPRPARGRGHSSAPST